MKSGLLLKTGIYLLGLYALYAGAQWAVYYAGAYISAGGFSVDFPESQRPLVYSNAVVPLLFALASFGFAGRITTFLLRRESNEVVILGGTPDRLQVTLGIKFIGLFVLSNHAGPFVATVFELIAVKSGSRHFATEQVFVDMIANTIGLSLAGLLLFRTDDVIKRLFDAPPPDGSDRSRDSAARSP